MKILLDGRFYGLENAGLGRYTTNLVEELKKLDKVNQYVIFLRKKYFDILSFPKNWEKVEVEVRHYTIREQLLLPSLIRKYNPDLVHFPHFNVPILWHGNYIVTIHDLLMHKFKGKETTNLPAIQYLPKRIGYYIAFLKAVKGARKIIVPSKFVKDDVVRTYGKKESDVIVTYEGVDKKFSKKVSKEKVFKKYKISGDYFIYTGNAYPHKNLERAIDAVVQLNKERRKKAQLLISSVRDVFTQKLARLVEKKSIGKFVKLLGFVPDEELATLYKEAIAFVYPSLSEGFGLQGMEAITAGTIVLGSDIPVFKEVYGESIIYFDPLTTDSIKQSMDKALKFTTDEKEKIIKKAKDFVLKYSWTKMAKQTLKVYESCTGLRQG